MVDLHFPFPYWILRIQWPFPKMVQWLAPEVVPSHHRIVQQQKSQVGNYLGRKEIFIYGSFILQWQ